ncbi:MAG: flagellar protein FlaF [Gammaproteobacteria bacterium]
MNVIEQARQAYAPTQFPLHTPRSVEAELISKVTANLKKAASNAKADYPKFISALYENRRLWTTMAVDVADDNNTLPAPLRAQIFYLAEFTEIHSSKIINHDASADVLVEINTSVLRGLNNVKAT